jgi:hypothetical protein
LVELFGRYSLDKLTMRLKLSRQIPRRAASPTTSQVTKRGFADVPSGLRLEFGVAHSPVT